MQGTNQEQTKIVYRLLTGKEHNPFNFPIYRLDLDYSPGGGALLYIAFAVDHVFMDELKQFFFSTDVFLRKFGFRSVSGPHLRSDDAGAVELQTYRLKYVGKIDLGDPHAVARLMRRVAAMLGTPSYASDFSVISPAAVLSLRRLSLRLQLVM